ncbi:MAG: preprotein translocase subunit SecE [Anaerotruncus sp.]|nr:preprotein translocase subunit SecE [Anaerotruncus sp.]
MADNAAQKKPGFIERTKLFFRDIKGEMKKIVWPDRAHIVKNTAIVIGVLVLAALVVAALDTIAGGLLQLFVGLI